MNKILLSIGYNTKLILPDDCDSGAVIAAIARGMVVDSHGYGKDEKFTPASCEFGLRTIAASSIVADDEGKARIEADELRSSLESMRSLYMSTKKELDAANAAAGA